MPAITRLLLLLPLLGACDPSPQVMKTSIAAFGTEIQVTLIDTDDMRLRQALAIVREDLEYMQRSWHPWSGGNPVSRVNGLLRYQVEFSGPPSMLPMIAASKDVYQRSHGLFNPALGELFALWHFQGEDLTGVGPPEPAAIAELMDNPPTMAHIEMNGIRLRGHHPRLKLDFSGISKGYGIGQIIQHLQQIGIQHARIQAGGDLKVIGEQNGRPWRVAIRHPRAEGNLAEMELSDGESVFTSGDYTRYFIHNGVRYHHILDPRTGYPARGTQSVTVIHTDATLADAAATTLFIAGPEQWREIAKDLGIVYVLLVDAQGRLHMTPEMEQRLIMPSP